eukprot:GEMP01014413.1.p1 GENE.GEMP01014413.1~~GEMP01014413.1.p1  ORF type:complete len:630 (+),score=158.23 GEMP01014413.1:73-1962(+)
MSQDELPIRTHRESILHAIKTHPVVILVAETGSGKTTQLPQFLHPLYTTSRGSKIIACTQPRRVACTSVAARVAHEMQTDCGQLVGYKIRFVDNTTRGKTKILFLTDGMAVREASLDPNFSNYSVLILDEAHERSIHTDLMLGLALQALEKRRDLRVVVMSATLNIAPLVNFFGEERSKVLQIRGREHPVKIWYTPNAEDDWLEAALLTVLQIHIDREGQGDILVFLPGQDSIEQLSQLLKDKRKLLPAASTMDLAICPLFAALPFEQQVAVFDPAPPKSRKVVLATNIAETSITIPGIKFVVDCGYVKLRISHPSTGLETLKLAEISQAMANQRSGRAGREGPGECFRLFTGEAFEKLADETPPEILRSEMSQVYLTLKNLNIDIEEFPFLDRPPAQSLTKAGLYLKRIGALTAQKQLTERGKKLAILPLHPQFGALLLASAEFECVVEILTITAMLSVDAVFYSTRKENQKSLLQTLFHVHGDHLTMLNIYRAWNKSKSGSFCSDFGVNGYALKRAKNIRGQLKELLGRVDIQHVTSCGDNLDQVRKCLVKACFTHTARVESSGYVTIVERGSAKIHPYSLLFARKPAPPLIVYNDLVTTTKNYLRVCTAVEPEWLTELCSNYFSAA